MVAIFSDLARPFQREIIEAALEGFDVYVQAATSFGKSLCFQLPAVVDHGSEFGPQACFAYDDLHMHSHDSGLSAA